MSSNIVQIQESKFEPFNEINERSKNEVTQYTLEVDVKNAPLLLENNESLKTKLKLTTDVPNKNEELELSVKNGEAELIKTSLALTDETFGIKIPDLHEKYIAIENRDFKKIAKTFDLPQEYIDMIPDKLPSAMTEEEKLKLEAISKKLITKITEQFDENSYVAEKNIQVNINSNDIVANRYSLVMSTKTIYTVLTTFINDLFEDQDFLDLCKDRVTTEQLDELKKSYDEFLEENPVDEIEDETIKLSVYASGGKTVKTEVAVNENVASVVLEKNETESTMTFVSKTPKTDTNDVGMTTTAVLKNTFANNSGELSCTTKVEYNKDDIKALQDEFDTEDSDSSFIETDYTEIYEDYEQKYTITTTKSNDSTIVGKVKFEGDDLNDVNDMLNISFKCQFGNAKVNTINPDEDIIINDYTLEDYQKLLVDIIANATATAENKPESLIGIIFSNFSNSFLGIGEEDNDPVVIRDANEDENNNFLPSNETEIIDTAITNGLTECLNLYKKELVDNPEADLGVFLTVENVQEYCGDRYTLELLDSSTIKCIIDENGEQKIYYAIMNIDGYDLVVTDVEVLTEEDYLNR